MKNIIAWFALLTSISAYGQGFTVVNNITKNSSFIYRWVNQQYITNENNYFLDQYADTLYLKFVRQMKNVYKMTVWRNLDKKVKYNGVDTTLKMEYLWKFNDSGQLEELLNYSEFANLLSVFDKRQFAEKFIDDMEYQSRKLLLSNSMAVASRINSNFVQMFSIAGDTFNTSVTKLRIKNVQSPITKRLVPIMGTLTCSELSMEPLMYEIHGQNKADSTVKTYLVEELLQYTKGLDSTRFTKNKEIKKVGLNSEQYWIWNYQKGYFNRIELSDVFVINMQSRGNIRIFELWEYEE